MLQGNLVVDQDGNVQLCDFGLSRIRYEISRTRTTIREGGRLRFLAPELTLGDEEGFFRINEASDIYAFAMTILSLGTQAPPFPDISNEWAAAEFARQGKRPSTPRLLGNMGEEQSARVMVFVVAMWSHNPVLRPSAAGFRPDLESMM